MRGRNCCLKKLFVQIFSIPSFFWIRIRPDPNLQPREPLSSFMLAWRIKSTMEPGTRLWFRVFASSRQRHFADAQTQMPIRNALPRKTGDAKFCSCLRKIDLVEKERHEKIEKSWRVDGAKNVHIAHRLSENNSKEFIWASVLNLLLPSLRDETESKVCTLLYVQHC